jgi:hypothetical protein
VRLIPDSETDGERASIRALFNHRLSSVPLQARAEWLDIVEGRHKLWTDISSEKRELIRSIFNHMNMEIVKRARPSSVFNFAKASIGNLFLTGYVFSCLLRLPGELRHASTVLFVSAPCLLFFFPLPSPLP